MKEKMHKVYTEIPQRSYDALARGGALEDVLLALIVDPDEARDVADEIKSRRMERPPTTVDDFVDLGAKALEAWRITILQWALRQRNASVSLGSLAVYDKRLAVWAACKVAREAVSRFVPPEETRPDKALNATEDWLREKATLNDVEITGEHLLYIALEYSRSNMAAARDATFAAQHVIKACLQDENATRSLVGSVVMYASSSYADNIVGASPDYNAWIRARDTEEIRLRSDVAEACFTFPARGE